MKFFLQLVLFPVFWLSLVGAEEVRELGFEDLSETDRLFIAVLSVQLSPEESETVYAKSSGVFQLFQPSGSPVQKDELWGILNPHELDLERRSYSIENRSFPEKLAKLKLAHQELVAKARVALNEAQTELAEFRALIAVAEVQQQGDPERFQIADEELAAVVARAQATLTLAEEGVAHEAEIEKLKIAKQRQEAALEDKVYESEYRVSFDGILQLIGALKTKSNGSEVLPREVRITAGEPIAVIKNESAYRALVKPLKIDFEGVSRSKLFMVIDSEKGESAIQARFSSLVTDPRNPTVSEQWSFSVLEEDVADVKSRDAGSQAFASIYCDLGEKTFVVSKSVLLSRLPEGGRQARSWRQVLSLLIPDSVLVAEGRGALAIRRREDSPE